MKSSRSLAESLDESIQSIQSTSSQHSLTESDNSTPLPSISTSNTNTNTYSTTSAPPRQLKRQFSSRFVCLFNFYWFILLIKFVGETQWQIFIIRITVDWNKLNLNE